MHKAVILAAGRGTRMGNLTDDLPKPMLEVTGKPLIGHVIERLTEAGLRQFLLVTGYKAEIIEEYAASLGVEVIFQRQEQQNGTARAAALAAEFAARDPFLLTFGDIIAAPNDYKGLVSTLESDATVQAVLGVKHVPDPYQGAAVYEKGGRVSSIIEKPPQGTSTTNWNSAGVYAFQPVIFEEIQRTPMSPRGEYEITTAIQQMIARGLDVRIHALSGNWRDVGRPEDLSAAGLLLKG